MPAWLPMALAFATSPPQETRPPPPPMAVEARHEEIPTLGLEAPPPISVPSPIPVPGPPAYFPPRPPLPLPPHDGKGLLIASGALMVGAIALQATGLGVGFACANRVADGRTTVDSRLDAVWDCTLQPDGDLDPAIAGPARTAVALDSLSGVALAGAVVTAGLGAGFWGRRDAHLNHRAGDPAGLTGRLLVGWVPVVAGGFATSMGVALTAADVCVVLDLVGEDPDEVARDTIPCRRQVLARAHAAMDGGAILLALGVGMLSYHYTYTRHHERLRQITVAPMAGSRRMGLTLGGRF